MLGLFGAVHPTYFCDFRLTRLNCDPQDVPSKWDYILLGDL